MNAVVFPSAIEGETTAPSSKSYTHRALIAAALSSGKCTIHNTLQSKDILYTISGLEALGVTCERADCGDIVVYGTKGDLCVNKPSLFLENSGTTARLLTSLAAIARGSILLDGIARMRCRPMGDIVALLRNMGVEIEAEEDHLPMRITGLGGSLTGGTYSIPGNTSSQFVSSILLVAPLAKRDTLLRIEGTLVSQSYVDITLDVMRSFGIRVETNQHREYFIPGNQTYSPIDYWVEGDYSNASYFFAGAAVCGTSMTVWNLRKNSMQGDRQFLDLLEQAGCEVRYLQRGTQEGIYVRGAKAIKPVAANLSSCPDIVQSALAVFSFARGSSEFSGIEHLRYKETDRISSPVNELRRLGIHVMEKADGVTLHGGLPKGNIEVETYLDHRMVMSFCILALGAEQPTTIRGIEEVSKSFPEFFDKMISLGAQISVEQKNK